MKRLGGLVNNIELWKEFLAHLEEEEKRLRNYLEREEDTLKIYRLQGELRYIRQLKQLREQMNG